jgi:hypothetical protein
LGSCEEDVIVICGLYLFQKTLEKKGECWIHHVLRGKEGEEEFYTLFGRLKDDRQTFSGILE